jgi:hypothetical protein
MTSVSFCQYRPCGARAAGGNNAISLIARLVRQKFFSDQFQAFSFNHLIIVEAAVLFIGAGVGEIVTSVEPMIAELEAKLAACEASH